MTINVTKNDGAKVICPYCEKEIKTLIEKPVQGGLITRSSVYACEYCKKPIPVSSRTYVF